jgi:hypothetical protein
MEHLEHVPRRIRGGITRIRCQLVKKGELQIWSLQISSFPPNSSSPAPTAIFSIMDIETFNHAESTADAQEKQARSYELGFAENKKLVNSKFGVPLF